MARPSVVLLSQGDEIVTGQTLDTNAAWIAEQLTGRGFDVVRHVTVGDRMGDLVQALREATTRAQVVVCTGGLGPTEDDLTAEACARAFECPLALDPEALAHLEALFRSVGREIATSNYKQILLPQGCTRLDNPLGTAPGFAIEAGSTLVACLPGVPHEMRAMFREGVLPLLAARFQVPPGRLVTLRTTGIGESALQDRIGPFLSATSPQATSTSPHTTSAHTTSVRTTSSPPDAVLGYRTSVGENQVKLRFRAGVDEAVVQAIVADLRERIGSPVFAVEGLGEPGGSLAEVVAGLLGARGETLVVAESCTGGQLAALCTAVAGASAWFLEGCVTYSDASKQRRLGVPAALLAEHGAVSEPVARAMAEGARDAAGASYGLGVTGIAGPAGGTTAKPVGTVHLALATPSLTHHRLLRLVGDRHRIQGLTAHAALDLLRRHLQGALPSHP